MRFWLNAANPLQEIAMTLASRLAAGETLFTAWSGVPDSLIVEIMALQPFDAVTLDMQHGGHNEDSVLRGLLPVLRAGRHALVRIPVGRFDMASRALDFGAEAVIAPMINSVEDARRFAAAMKYPPRRRALMGTDLRLSAPRQGRFFGLARRIERPHHGLRHGRDARRAGGAGRHSRNARDRRHLSRAVGFLDRLEQWQDDQRRRSRT